jgi:hypothetical protein
MSKILKSPHRRLLRLPVAQDFAKDDGVGEVAVLKVYIGEELVVEGGEKGLDVGFVEAGVFEDDHGACYGAIRKIVKIYGGKVLAIAESEKALG